MLVKLDSAAPLCGISGMSELMTAIEVPLDDEAELAALGDQLPELSRSPARSRALDGDTVAQLIVPLTALAVPVFRTWLVISASITSSRTRTMTPRRSGRRISTIARRPSAGCGPTLPNTRSTSTTSASSAAPPADTWQQWSASRETRKAFQPAGPYGDQSCKVQAAIDLYGPMADREKWIPTLVDAANPRATELTKQITPYHLDKADPPILILHGTADTTVPMDD